MRALSKELETACNTAELKRRILVGIFKDQNVDRNVDNRGLGLKGFWR